MLDIPKLLRYIIYIDEREREATEADSLSGGVVESLRDF